MLVVILKSIGMSCILTSSSSSPSGTVSSTGAERLFLALEAAVGGGAHTPADPRRGCPRPLAARPVMVDCRSTDGPSGCRRAPLAARAPRREVTRTYVWGAKPAVLHSYAVVSLLYQCVYVSVIYV